MMKKIYTAIAAACLLAAPASAKGLSDMYAAVFPNDYFATHGHVWIVRAGLHLNYAVGVDLNDDYDYTNNNAAELSVAWNKPLGSWGLFWAIEGGLSTRGYKGIDRTDYTNDNSYKYHGHTYYTYDHIINENTTTLTAYNVYLQPVTIGYRRTVWKQLSIEARVGAYVSFDIFGEEKIEKYKYKHSTNSQYDINDYDETNSETSVKIKDDDAYNRIDIGVAPSIGIWWSRIGVDVTYRRGFYRWWKSADIYSQQLEVRLSYAF